MTNTNGHIFISYASADRDRVENLASLFQAEGWAVWWDRDNIPAGQQFHRAIDQAILDAACVLVCWSEAAINSDWVLEEANEAKDQKKLLPVNFETVRVPLGHRSYNYIDLSNWDDKATHPAYQRLKAELVKNNRLISVVSPDSIKQPKAKSDSSQQQHPKQNSTKPETVPAEIQRLLDQLTSPSIEPAQRLQAGDKLAELGDPRRGVGLDADGLPDIDWVKIPAGEFLYGEKKQAMEIEPYYIARYPITNEQYDAFIRAGGYKDERWWQGLAERIEQPEKPGWPQPNRPRETVSWYEAIAFCRWLSDRLGYEITLPTEQQWECAARGSDGREYPWGDDYQSGFANVNEKRVKAGTHYLEQTSSVGMYAFAGSPQGIQDLSGNVDEWCLNFHDNLENTSTEGREPRVLRGGSWDRFPRLVRTSLRYGYGPDSRNLSFGFRVVCSSPIPR